MSTKKALLIVVLVVSMATIIQAQEIIFLSYNPGDTSKNDPVTGESPDMPHVYALEDAGYNVTLFYTASLSTDGQDTLDMLEEADLIVLGRSTPSTGYMDPHKEAWNSITTPILNLEMWAARNIRLNWFNTESMLIVADSGVVFRAYINEPDDPVFEGLDVSDDSLDWVIGPFDAIGTTDGGLGEVLASLADGTVLFVRFEPDVEFYPGTNDAPWGWRSFIGNGRDNSSLPPYNYYNFTPESEQVFLAEVENLIILGGYTAINEQENTATPATFELSQNFPNPFNPTTTIPFNLPEKSHVRLSLINILGEVVAEIVNEEYGAGYHEIVFNGENLAAGLYFYKIQTEEYSAVKKLVIVK